LVVVVVVVVIIFVVVVVAAAAKVSDREETVGTTFVLNSALTGFVDFVAYCSLTVFGDIFVVTLVVAIFPTSSSLFGFCTRRD
jgi:hypothetical protein